MLTPKEPNAELLENYFIETLRNAKAYQIDTPKVAIKLDQNESPWDWPLEQKEKILAKLKACEWNRYPEAYGENLHRLLGEYAGVGADCILTGPGSNTLISLIFDSMTRKLSGQMVIARPSFSLFEMHCNYAGLDYITWDLDENFDFDLERFPKNLADGSFVVFASPNNPTGSFLSAADLRSLLRENPKSYFLADEAYYEFNDEPYLELLVEFDNLLILRTLSKTMGAAGVRLGYAIGASSLIHELRKMRLPYMLNHFAMEAAKLILSEDSMKEFVRQNVDNVTSERERVFQELGELGKSAGYWIKPSKANFLLLRFKNQHLCDSTYQALIGKGILVRNISKGPGLAACFRVSLGTPSENQAFIEAMRQIFS